MKCGIEFATSPKLCCCTTLQMHSVHRARETVDILRLAGPMASKYPRSEPSLLQDLGYHATSCLPDKICSVDERRVIDVWCGLEQSTINMASDY